MAFIQAHNNGANPSASLDVTLATQNVAAGDLVTVHIRSGSGTNIAVSDNLSNTYTQRQSENSGTFRSYESIIANAGACTVTVTQDSARLGIEVHHYTSMDASPFDQAGYASGTGTTAASSAVNTTTANQWLVGFFGGSATPTWEADYTSRTTHNITGRTASANRNVSATLTGEIVSATIANSAWEMSLTTWKEAAGAAAASCRPKMRAFFGVGR